MKKLKELVFKKQSSSQNAPPKKKKLGASIKWLVLDQPRLHDTPSQKMKWNKQTNKKQPKNKRNKNKFSNCKNSN